MTRSRYALRRIVQLIPILFGVSTVVFLLVQLIPGDPAEVFLGPQAHPDQIAALRADLGLDRSLGEQYRDFLAGLVRGDLGDSLRFRAPVTEVIADRWSPTVFLVAYAAALTILISVPMAVLAARRPGGVIDGGVRAFTLIGLGMPSFWLGILLILGLALGRGWFPVSGYGTSVAGHFHHLFLPALTIAISMSPITIRSLRTALIEVLDAEFLVAARAKGIGGSRLLFAYSLRNAIVPTVTVLGVNLGWLIGNTVVIERLFVIPGLGATMLEAIGNRDFPLVQALAMVFAILVVGIGLTTELLRATLDPRVELG